jgi:hypothetical protein
MAHVWQDDHAGIFARHQASIAASLAHRLEIARAAQNTQLIALLEQEQRQLGLQSTVADRWSSLGDRVSRWWQACMVAIDQHSQLSVQQVSTESGEILWRAYDPHTGKTLYADSKAEVVKWIEDNGLGR